MNKDEILAKSRKENKGLDEMERSAYAHAGKIATAVGGLMCMAIILLEAIFSDFASYSMWAVYLAITGTTLLVKYFKLRKLHELIFGLLQLALSAAFLAIHIIHLAG